MLVRYPRWWLRAASAGLGLLQVPSYSLQIEHPPHFSGLRKLDPVTRKVLHQVPLRHDPIRNQWTLELIVSTDLDRGRRLAKLLAYRRRLNSDPVANRRNSAMKVFIEDVPVLRVLFNAFANTTTDIQSPAAPADPDLSSDPWPEDGVDGDDNSPECLKFGRFKPLSRRQLHETLGHYGKCPWGCLICLIEVDRVVWPCRCRCGFSCDIPTLYTLPIEKA